MNIDDAVRRGLERAGDDIMEDLAPTIQVYEEMRHLLQRMIASYTRPSGEPGESMVDLIKTAEYLEKKLRQVSA